MSAFGYPGHVLVAWRRCKDCEISIQHFVNSVACTKDEFACQDSTAIEQGADFRESRRLRVWLRGH